MLVVIQLGSHSFRAAAFKNQRLLHTETLDTAGWSITEHSGFSKAQTNIECLLQKIEQQTGRLAEKVILIFSYRELQFDVIQVTSTVSGTAVTESDRNEVIDLAREYCRAKDLSLLHIDVVVYKLDNGVQIDSPLGMRTSKLQANCAVISQPTSIYTGWMRVFKSMPKRISNNIEFISGSHAAKYFIQKKLGCVCVFDIGNYTKAYIYHNGHCVKIITVNTSGDDFTENIAKNLKISIPEATRAKYWYCRDPAEEFERISVKLDAHNKYDAQHIMVPRSAIFQAVHSNLEKVCSSLRNAVNSTKWGDLIEEFILIGGGAALLNARTVTSFLKRPTNIPIWHDDSRIYGTEWSSIFAVGYTYTSLSEGYIKNIGKKFVHFYNKSLEIIKCAVGI